MNKKTLNRWVIEEPKLKWYSVALFNLIVLSITMFFIIKPDSGANALAFIPFLFTLGASSIPVLIAHSNSEKKLLIGYVVLFFILLPVPYFVWDAMTCTGKFCSMGSELLAMALGVFGIIFAFFFTFSYFSRFWDKAVAIIWSILMPIYLLGLLGLANFVFL